MINADPFDVPYPGATIHWLGPAGAPARHDVRRTDNTAMALSLIVGDSRDAGHLEAARRMATAREARSLCLAVMACSSAEQEQALVETLGTRCDAVVAVAPDADLVASAEALCSAILSPLAAGHPWCFDWNDMRELCTQTPGIAPARLFAARARGAHAVEELTATWHANAAAGPRKLLLGVGLPMTGLMARHHEIMQALTCTRPAPSVVGSGILFDTALLPDEVALTIIDFGPAPLRQPDVVADISDHGAISGLPEFLRRA